MSLILAVAALATLGGGLAAVTARDARIALAAMTVAMCAAPFLADPLPTPGLLGVRVVAVLLGSYLISIVLRDSPAMTRGTLVGLPTEALAAAAGFAIGYGTSGLGAPALGPAAAQAAGFALVVITLGPIVRGSDVFRLGLALALLLTGVELVRVGLSGTPSVPEQLATAILTVGLLGTNAVLSVHAIRITGHLGLDSTTGRASLAEAHPAAPAELARGDHHVVREAGHSRRVTSGPMGLGGPAGHGGSGSLTGPGSPSGTDRTGSYRSRGSARLDQGRRLIDRIRRRPPQ